ncbi:hypothetical protein F2Q69_00020941 [Brassica cretica]|uniref:Uncharacterized protein n=1 Tax=Brassica cretica TaxID=69181 RepID=A0A8S9PZL2_BRACR|nr:hypothetical protein F2Q69_00020941 [Brassica cretica]
MSIHVNNRYGSRVSDSSFTYYPDPDPDSADLSFYYPDSDSGCPDILNFGSERSGSRIESRIPDNNSRPTGHALN